MPVDTIGRELIELVQIDQDFCNNTYGVAPCEAQVYQFNFNGDGRIDIPVAKFSGDFNISGKFTASDLNGLDGVLGTNQASGKNVIKLRKLGGSDPANLQLVLYNGTTVEIAENANLITLNDEISFEIQRVGDVISYYVNGIYEGGGTITSGLTFEFESIGTIAGAGSREWFGKIYNILLVGEDSGDRFYAINDNSNNIADDISGQDGVLTAGTGAWSGTGMQKCFNTFVTCQDKPNYDKGVKQITFKKNQAGDIEEFTIPILNNFNVTLPELNFFSRDTKNQALGKFGKCTATFSDTIFSDNHLDPYVSERNYNPLERGTFWTKWLARNPFYEGWKIRLYDGLVGQTLAEMNVREYELEKISNPDTNGNVTIKATDLMRKLDKSKAIFPPASNCELADSIVSGQTFINTVGRLAPYTPTIEQERYILVGPANDSSAASTAPILSEIDNGNGTFTYNVPTINVNADAGTRCENGCYWAGDSPNRANLPIVVLGLLELVYEPSQYNAFEVVTELTKITDFAQFITHYIAEPTPVGVLLAELEVEFGFVVYYDDIEKMIKVKSITDEDSPVITIDQNNDLVLGKTSSKTVTEDRFTDVYIQYNALKDFTIEENKYFYSLLFVDSEASGENEYNGIVTYPINTRWMLQLQTAEGVAERVLTQFRDPVREITFELDIKNDLRMAQVFKLAWRGYTDIYGNPEEINWICTGRTRSRDRLKITAQEFKFNVPEA